VTAAALICLLFQSTLYSTHRLEKIFKLLKFARETRRVQEKKRKRVLSSFVSQKQLIYRSGVRIVNGKDYCDEDGRKSRS
jgi:hypothetical protein